MRNDYIQIICAYKTPTTDYHALHWRRSSIIFIECICFRTPTLIEVCHEKLLTVDQIWILHVNSKENLTILGNPMTTEPVELVTDWPAP